MERSKLGKGVVFILILVFVGAPVFLFPKLQGKLESKVEQLPSYQLLEGKTIEVHGRDAYLTVTKGVDEVQVNQVIEAIEETKGIRKVKLIYTEATTSAEDSSQKVASTEEKASDTEASTEEKASDTEASTEEKATDTEASTEEKATDTEASTEEKATDTEASDEEMSDVDLEGVAPIMFAHGTAELTAESKETLKVYAEKINRLEGEHFTIIGHTDSGGSAKGNEELSLARAESVVQVLIAEGVQGDWLTAVGKGEMAPIASNETEEGRKRNRRVEILKGDYK